MWISLKVPRTISVSQGSLWSRCAADAEKTGFRLGGKSNNPLWQSSLPLLSAHSLALFQRLSRVGRSAGVDREASRWKTRWKCACPLRRATVASRWKKRETLDGHFFNATLFLRQTADVKGRQNSQRTDLSCVRNWLMNSSRLDVVSSRVLHKQ